MMRQVSLLLLFSGLLSVCHGIGFKPNRSYKLPVNPGQPDTPVLTFDDCPSNVDEFIKNALTDAVAHGRAARDILDNVSRATRFTTLYDKLFTDNTIQNGRPATLGIASKYDDLIENRSLPKTITVHCDEGWAQALYSLRSKGGLSATFVGCGANNIATGFTITSRATGAAVTWGFGGSEDAFSSGTHLLLCPEFFHFPISSGLKPAAVGMKIDTQRTQGMILLHELFHMTSRDILDGGYGYQGCLNVANGIYPEELKKVKPTFNADTYALFSLACIPGGNMNQFDWTTGVAAKV